MQIQVDEIELHVTDEGDRDAPPVLLLHGITQSTRTWDWLVPHLVERHRVLRLDFRGHGRSGRAPAYGFDEWIADARGVCEQVAGGPCLVVGHSLGGGVAAALAQQHPDLVQATVLEDPALAFTGDPSGTVGPGGEGSSGHALVEGFAAIRRTVPMLQEAGMSVEALAGALAPAPSPTGPAFGQLLHDDSLVAMADGLLGLDAAVLDGVLDGTTRPAFDPEQPLPVPALLVAADPASPDGIVATAVLDQLAAVSPHVEVHVFDGAGHLVHDERAHRERFLELTLDFLART
jgi:pimeloyl-ACP methyl ester carboxylesterase